MPRTVALDCRWLTYTGAGRLVELLLRGFDTRPMPNNWILWGPPAAQHYAWPDAGFVATDILPNTWRGQRDWFRIPTADLVVFMHQQRPLRPVPSLTTVLDITPVQFPNGRIDRVLKAQFLKRAASISLGILTISHYSRDCIISELDVPAEKVRVLDVPADAQLAARVLDLRAQLPRTDVALYLGLFLVHKNLPRLLSAFGRTSFCKEGGRLLLVGGRDGAAALAATLDGDQRRYVEIRPYCSQAEVEELLATSLFLVQPSLAEGFGLPVWEALASGLPVCVSDGGALPEIANGFAEPFPARSVDAMTDAIDSCAARARRMGPGDDRALSTRLLGAAPNVGDFAAQFEAIVDQHLELLPARKTRGVPRA